MTDVTSRLKTNKGPCDCGEEECKEWGTYKRGTQHVKTCTACLSCRNGFHSKKGKKSERKVGYIFGKLGKGIARGGEQFWRLVWRVEVKDDKQAQQVGVFYRRTKEQSDKDHAYGDPRPYVAIAVCDGVAYAVHRLLDTDNVVDAWIEGAP